MLRCAKELGLMDFRPASGRSRGLHVSSSGSLESSTTRDMYGGFYSSSIDHCSVQPRRRSSGSRRCALIFTLASDSAPARKGAPDQRRSVGGDQQRRYCQDNHRPVAPHRLEVRVRGKDRDTPAGNLPPRLSGKKELPVARHVAGARSYRHGSFQGYFERIIPITLTNGIFYGIL